MPRSGIAGVNVMIPCGASLLSLICYSNIYLNPVDPNSITRLILIFAFKNEFLMAILLVHNKR